MPPSQPNDSLPAAGAMTAEASIGALPHALRDEGELARRFAGREPAIFRDYDGTLTRIVDLPEDS